MVFFCSILCSKSQPYSMHKSSSIAIIMCLKYWVSILCLHVKSLDPVQLPLLLTWQCWSRLSLGGLFQNRHQKTFGNSRCGTYYNCSFNVHVHAAPLNSTPQISATLVPSWWMPASAITVTTEEPGILILSVWSPLLRCRSGAAVEHSLLPQNSQDFI